jgi:hypothetical protein
MSMSEEPEERGRGDPALTLEGSVVAGVLAPHELLEKARANAADAKAPRTRRE